jgi:YVTN family beta-propeller protein
VAIPVFAFGQASGGGGVRVNGNAVAIIDPHTNSVVDQVPNVGSRPASIAYGSGSLWVANLDDQTIARIDPNTRTVTRVAVQDPPTGLATTSDAVWVVGSNAGRPSVTVRRIDPEFNTVTEKRRLGNIDPGEPGSVGTRGRAVWIAPSSGFLSRMNPRTAKVVQRVDPNASPIAIAVGSDAIWVADNHATTVTRIDPTGLLTPVGVGHGPSAITLGAGAVWVADSLDDRVVRIDPSIPAATATFHVGAGPSGLAFGGGSVWVANARDGTVSRIDAAKERVTTIHVGGSPQALTYANGRV